MPPKVKYTREEILQAAVNLTRERGFEAVTARDVGARLGTSAKPVYTAFAGMNELKAAVIEEAGTRFDAFRLRELADGKYPAYKCIGMAYIRFAKEERNLFRLLFMRDRRCEVPDTRALGYQDSVRILENQTGLDEAAANLFHAEMWVAVHGIAVTFATAYQDWDMELVGRMLTDIYEGLNARQPLPASRETFR